MKVLNIYILFLFSIVLMLANACTHEVDLSNLPEVSFSKDINPIIITNCTQSGCHGTEYPEFELLTYEQVMEEGDIKPGNPEDSDLYEKIIDSDDHDRMPPPPREALPEDKIKTIYLWILQGAKNN